MLDPGPVIFEKFFSVNIPASKTTLADAVFNRILETLYTVLKKLKIH